MSGSFGNNKNDPLQATEIIRVIAMSSDGNSYPDQATIAPFLARKTDAASIAAGFSSVTFKNSHASANSTVLGTTLKPGEAVTFASSGGAKLPALAYSATGGELLVNGN